ncbi:hypothetical protein P5673_008493 [Acropora cervicornis]|uniref:Uncharacterized protein n=1 Tax=Acropora cervicornis TaxID=6130 RepID=A0AAD9QUH1_ACRCE|nr:hypothetical protein P5673_008493 [Acropora cervicornis]
MVNIITKAIKMNKRSSLAQLKSGRLKKFRGFQKTFNFHGNSTKSKLKETEFSTRKHFSNGEVTRINLRVGIDVMNKKKRNEW